MTEFATPIMTEFPKGLATENVPTFPKSLAIATVKKRKKHQMYSNQCSDLTKKVYLKKYA